jgi:hypothetical protein
MTLVELIAAHPDLFARQTWYADEPFMVESASSTHPWTPTTVLDADPDSGVKLPRAVFLAACYVADPTAHVWDRYLWTSTKDALGQRIYMGINHGKMEIHRHIHITPRFGVPQWPF